ncbi:MAG TPA: universal stress protein [Baekduia sp.]|uniref:universal stress protein n=1 Tax=Baekduia sp. TaxID=2600305 RepID=UPI002CA2978D|nr:universal stress protein [Baekduia sp.]HMJ34512.1 universal stress protein [Baekduia sp.]
MTGSVLSASDVAEAPLAFDPFVPRRILVVLDGSRSSWAALECGVDLARSRGCSLTLMVVPAPAKRLLVLWASGTAVAVVTRVEGDHDTSAHARQMIARARGSVPAGLDVAIRVVRGDASGAIWNDLVLGSHQLAIVGRTVGRRLARRRLRRALLRTTAELTPVLVLSSVPA